MVFITYMYKEIVHGSWATHFPKLCLNLQKMHKVTWSRCEKWKTYRVIGIIAWICFFISLFSADKLMYASTWNSTQQFLKITCQHCGQETEACICLVLLPPHGVGTHFLSLHEVALNISILEWLWTKYEK